VTTEKNQDDQLVEAFEANRDRLNVLARRILGSDAEAQDVVQEAWLRLSRSHGQGIASMGAWLTTVVARLCLDVLRRRSVRGELPLNDNFDETEDPREDPAGAMELADSIAVGLTIVLDKLPPLERVAFVLHDMFDVPFDEVARVVGRSSDAARQLASRGRRRVRGASPQAVADRERKKELVEAFLAAARNGDYCGLLRLLDPDVVVEADTTVVPRMKKPILGSEKAAKYFNGKAQAARVALVGTDIGAIVDDGRTFRIVLSFEIKAGRISRISATADAMVFRSAVALDSK
jgi:RNA polymerase sigma-70 factor (ECF subfamily)